MANQITVNSGTGNITVTTSRSVIGTVANVASANYANFAGEANTANSATVAASANSVALANVSGAGNIASINLDGNVSNVLRGDGTFSGLPDSANANFANFAGTVTNSAQPNITSLGTLGNLTVSGTIETEDLVVNGNLSVGNLVANNANYANFAGEAYDVNVANVTGIGNIATVNLDGNASTVLYGNGTFNALPDTANANYANFAGNAFSVDGANVSGAVANASHAVVADSANAVAGANVSGEVSFAATANAVAGANVSGEVSFAATANAVAGANVSGEVANANFATNAGTSNIANVAYSVDGANVSGEVAVANVVSNPTQSNITAVGTLGNLDVSGTITANLIQANTIEGNIALTQVDYIDFDTANGSPGFQTGRVSWDSAKGTLALDMNGSGNITQQVGEDQYIYVKANATITSGQVVMFNGVQGDTILGAPANTASVGFLPRYVIGVAPANIANGSFGYVQTIGEVYDQLTNAFSVGSILYLQANSAGALTATEPTAPDPKIVVAACLTQSSTPSATNGRLQVRPDFGYYMDQLHNVSNATPNTGDVLVYNASNVYTPGNTVPAWNVDGNLIVQDANVANISVIPGTATYDGYSAYTKLNKIKPDYGNFIFNSAELHTLENYETGVGFGVIKEDIYYVEDTANAAVAQLGFQDWSAVDVIGSGNVRVPGIATITVASTQTDLTTGSPSTMSSFQIGGQGGLSLVDGAGGTNDAFNIFHYNEGGLSFARRRGNGDSRSNVAANDLTSIISWAAAGVGSFGNGAPRPGVFINSNTAYISGKVDSTYTGSQGETVPVGVELSVVDSSDNAIAHSFYANGDVVLNGNVSASNLGNVSALDLDGNASNILFGNGVFAAAPTAGSTDSISNGNSSIGFTGVDGNAVITINSANTAVVSSNQVQVTGNIVSTGSNVTISDIPDTFTFDFYPSYSKRNDYDPDYGNFNFKSAELHLLKNFDASQSFGIVDEHGYYVEDTANAAVAAAGYDFFEIADSVNGNPTVPGLKYTWLPVPESDLAGFAVGTWTQHSIGGQASGLSTIVGANIGNKALHQFFNYSPVGIKFNRRNGNGKNSGSRLAVSADDYLADIQWQPYGKDGGGATAIVSSPAKFSAKVDSAYTGANAEIVPVGFELNAVSSNGAIKTHSFYANGSVTFSSSGTINGNGAGLSSLAGANVTGEVSFAATANSVALANVSGVGNIASIDLDGNSSNVLLGTGTFAPVPTPSSIANGTSNIAFTGSGGDINITVDGNVKSQFGPDGLKLIGANTGGANVARLDILNGGLQWILDNTQFSGGTPFGMNQYNNNDSLSYGLSFYRARGEFAAAGNVQAGDQGYGKSVQFYHNGGYVGSHAEVILANTFSGSDVAVTHAIAATSDIANSKFAIDFGEATFSDRVTANGNITGANVIATQFVVLANDTVANLTTNTPAVVGVAGAMIAVSDQDYQPASWSVTDNVWKYVSNRANV